MLANSILPIPLPDGVYCGTWRGFYVTISFDQEVTQFKVDKALRNRDFPCLITVKNKKAVIDSGNPLVNQNLDLPTAIKVLINELAKDKSPGSYYYTWQANIAMTFKDRYQQLNPNLSDTSFDILHNIANNAAMDFLDLFIDIKKPNNYDLEDRL